MLTTFGSDLAKLSRENGFTKNLGQNQRARAQWHATAMPLEAAARRAGLDCYNGLVGLAKVAALGRAAPAQSARAVIAATCCEKSDLNLFY